MVQVLLLGYMVVSIWEVVPGFERIGITGFTAQNVLLVMVVGSFLALLAVQPRNLARTRLDTAWLVFVSAGLFSICWGFARGVPVTGELWRVRWLLSMPAVFYLAVALRPGTQWVTTSTLMVVLISVGFAANGFLTFAGSPGVIVSARPEFTGLSGVEFGAWTTLTTLGQALIFAYGLSSAHSPLVKVGLFLMVALLGIPLLLTFVLSRYVAMITVMAMVVLLHWTVPMGDRSRIRRFNDILLAGAVAAVSLFFVLAVYGVILDNLLFSFGLQSFASPSTGINIRLHALWPRAIEMFSENPLVGMGAGSSWHWPGPLHGHGPHNIYLQALAEGGVIGLLVHLFFIQQVLAFLWSGCRATKLSNSSFPKITAILSRALLATFIGVLVEACFLDHVWVSTWWPYFLGLTGALAVTSIGAREGRRQVGRVLGLKA